MQKHALGLFLFLLCSASGQQNWVNPKLLAPLDPELSVPTRQLKATSSTLTEVPFFTFYDTAKCDQSGEMFFHTGSLNSMEVLKLKLIAGSAEPTVYKATSEFVAQKAGFLVNFSVSPSGDLWMIGESRDREYYLFSFDSNGDTKSSSKLDVPEHLEIRDFAVSNSGVLLISGYFDRSAASGLQGKTFISLLDSSGKIRKRLDLESQKHDFALEKLHEDSVVFGDDGLLYTLEPSGILVISPAGSLVRQIKFDKPPGFSAVNLALSSGYLAVWLYKPSKNGPTVAEFLVIDASTGESLALYKPTNETGDVALCYSRKEGFTMWQVENHRIRLTIASPS